MIYVNDYEEDQILKTLNLYDICFLPKYKRISEFYKNQYLSVYGTSPLPEKQEPILKTLKMNGINYGYLVQQIESGENFLQALLECQSNYPNEYYGEELVNTWSPQEFDITTTFNDVLDAWKFQTEDKFNINVIKNYNIFIKK